MVKAPWSESVSALLEQRARAEGERRFVKCSGEWRTFGQVDLAADELAQGLAELGVGQGDRVGVISANRDEAIDTFFACAKLGAIQVAFNTFLKGDFLKYQVADSGAKVVVVDGPGWSALRAVAPGTAVHTAVTMDPVDDGAPSLEVRSYEDVSLPAGGSSKRDRIELCGSDTMSILYTSGTTGMPKGCMLPHGYYRNIPEQFYVDGRMRVGDRIFSAFPFFHTSGQVYVLMLALGGPAELVLTTEFSASTFMRRAKAEEATVLLGVSAMAAAILAQPPSPEDEDPGTLRTATWLPFTQQDQLRFEDRFKVHTWGDGFGQTECMPMCHTAVDGPVNRNAAGLPVDYFELAILDDDDQEVPRGQVGEISVRPRRPNIMFQGYWGNPEATLESMRNLWYHTGDFGRQDGEGFVYFVDRKKQALRRRGENISSIELEGAIRKHPAVADVAVVPVPSPMTEDDVKAVLVLCEGETVQLAELFEFFVTSLPYFAVPRYVDFRDELPVNALGRVMKHLLKDEGVSSSTVDMEAMGFVVDRADRR